MHWSQNLIIDYHAILDSMNQFDLKMVFMPYMTDAVQDIFCYMIQIYSA